MLDAYCTRIHRHSRATLMDPPPVAAPSASRIEYETEYDSLTHLMTAKCGWTDSRSFVQRKKRKKRRRWRENTCLFCWFFAYFFFFVCFIPLSRLLPPQTLVARWLNQAATKPPPPPACQPSKGRRRTSEKTSLISSAFYGCCCSFSGRLLTTEKGTS